MQKNGIPLIKETIRIVENFISKNMIKAITIEESSDRLIIMEKQPFISSQCSSTNDLSFSRMEENIKTEKEDINSPVYTMDIEYSEPELTSIIETIKEEPIEIDSCIVEINDPTDTKENNVLKDSSKKTALIEEKCKRNENENFSYIKKESVKLKEDFSKILSINKQLSSLVQDLTAELEKYHSNLSNFDHNT